ncbi:MAG: electron transfer flavoprotein subunit alpha/FixB family protein [Planctomycetaceae bacterium]
MIAHRKLPPVSIWLVEGPCCAGTFERLGDARRLADELGAQVGAMVVGAEPDNLIAQGADLVVEVVPAKIGPAAFFSAVLGILRQHPVRLVCSGFDPDNRALAARLALRSNWTLVSPALMASAANDGLRVTELDSTGRQARQLTLDADQPAVVTLRDGVAQALHAEQGRPGSVVRHEAQPAAEPVVTKRQIPVDAATADIRHVRRLLCGGRGLGGAEGFRRLARVARLMDAGVAASRVAVDLGWIEHDRQVGQTGKTVRPDLYIGLGVSGASHHLDGMSESGHIIAVNSDPRAPLFQKAHLGLVADLHRVLDHLEQAFVDERP